MMLKTLFAKRIEPATSNCQFPTPKSIGVFGVWVLVVGSFAASELTAHHSFGVAFDANKTVTLTGTVTKIDWTNPHTHVYADVKDASGKVVNWKFEGYPPNVLARTGWKRDVTVKVGDTVTMFGYHARDGSPFAHLREVTLADGKRLFFGPPAGTGEGGPVAR